METLTRALRREHDLLDQLRFRGLEVRLLLEAGEVRYLPWATREVVVARRRARESDLARAATVDGLLAQSAWRSPTLRALAAQAPAPWSGMLRDHHESLCGLVAGIEVDGHRSADLARTAIHDLARACGPVAVDPDHDDIDDEAKRSVLIAPPDLANPLAAETALNDVITQGSRLAMPALVAFLR